MCLSPISIKCSTLYINKYIQVPCGRCIECLKDYQNNWMIRMYYEFKEHSKVCFVTLTYNNDHVPQLVDTETGEVHLSLCKEHLQKWFKRARRRSEYHKLGLNFRYFACGEYG